MADTLHEITRYAMRSSEPYARWADEVSRLKIETAERQERIGELEAALRTIQREAHGIDQYLYDVASEALGDE